MNTTEKTNPFGYLLMVVLAVGLGWPWFGQMDILGDEKFYLWGIKQIHQGHSPYQAEGYLYPPPLAYLGAWTSRHLGERFFLLSMRFLNLLGALCLSVWTLRALKVKGIWLFFGSLAGLWIFEPIRLGLALGNLSILTAALSLYALSILEKKTIQAGLFLGVSLLLKPTLAVGWFVLLCSRSVAARKAALLSGAFCFVVLLGFVWELPKMLYQLSHDTHLQVWVLLSWRNFLRQLGWELPPWPLTLLWLALGILWARGTQKPQAHQLEASVLFFSLYSLPIVWYHTLCILLPALGGVWREWWEQKIAQERHQEEVQNNHTQRTRWQLHGMGLVLLTLTILYSESFGDIRDLSSVVGVLYTALGLLSIGMVCYLAGKRRQADTKEEVTQQQEHQEAYVSQA